MAEKKDPLDKRFENMVEKLASLNQNAGLQVIHADKIADLTAERNRIAAKASGLDEEEAGRRADMDAKMLALQKEIQRDTAIAGEDAPKVMANQKILDKMKEKEEKKREKINFNMQKKIVSGLTDIGDNIGGKVAAGGSMLLKGIGVIALFAFLTSDSFKAIVGGIVNFVTDFVGLFTGSKDVLPFLGDHFGKVIALLTFIGLKLFAIGTQTTVAQATMTALQAAFTFLFGPKGVLMKNMIPRLKLMGAGLLVQGKAMMISLGLAFKGMLIGLGAILAPMLPVVAVVAAIAAAAYGVVRIFQGFQEHFSEANEQFGFFGGIIAGFTGGIKTILGDVVGVIDSILGFFGFPDLLDPVLKAIEEFDVMNFVGGVMDFFADIGNFITEGLASIGRIFKAIGAGAMAALTSPFSPIESFNKAFAEAMSGADVKPDLGNIAAAGAQMSGGENDPARFIARKENENMQMARKEEMMGDKRAVMITNNNVINKGGDSFSEVRGGDVNVHDNAQNPYYNPA